MSAYPPGVTGLEPQIAGYPETETTREVGECEKIGDVVVIRQAARDSRDWGRKHRRAQGITCTFTGGEVEGVITGDRYSPVFVWDCPVCQHTNDIELDLDDFGPDPDAEVEW